MPLAQMPWLATFLAVRTDDSASIAPTLRRIVASVDSTVAVSSVRPLPEILSAATAPARFRTVLTGVFALIAVAIASMGLYEIVS